MMSGLPPGLVQRLVQLSDCGRCLDDMVPAQGSQQLPSQLPSQSVIKQLW